MSDELEIAKLRTASPASGTLELIRRCHWAYARIRELEADICDLRCRVEAYEEMAAKSEPGVLRRQLELRRYKVRAEQAETRIRELEAEVSVTVKPLPEIHAKLTVDELRDAFGDRILIEVVCIIADRTYTTPLAARRAINRALTANTGDE